MHLRFLIFALWQLRVWTKLILMQMFLMQSFCRRCGSRVRDFGVDDAVWLKVDPLIKHGHTLCYDCFCDLCAEVGLSNLWWLVKAQTHNAP
jgi:hypothetical protein